MSDLSPQLTGSFDIAGYLGKFARKLLFVRAFEKSCLFALYGGACAIAVQAGWIVRPARPVSGILLALLPAIVVAVYYLRRNYVCRLVHSGGKFSNLLRYFAADRADAGFMRILAVVFSVAATIVLIMPFAMTLPHGVLGGGFVLCCWLCGIVLAVNEGCTPGDAALWLDRSGNLGERLVTAYELRNSGQKFSQVVNMQAAEAVRQFTPHKNRCGSYGVVLPLVLGCVIIFVSLLGMTDVADSGSRIQKQLRREAVASLAEQLKQDAVEAEAVTPASTELREHFKQLDKLSESMRWGEVSPERAASEMSRMESRLNESMKSAAAFESVSDRLSKIAQASGSPDQSSPAAQTLEAMDSDKLDDLGDRLAGEMSSASMSDQQADKWADTFEQAAGSAGADSDLADALDRAADAMRRMDSEQFSSAMSDASDASSKGRANSADRNQLARASQSISDRKQQLIDSASGMGSGLPSAGSGGVGAGDIDQAIARAGGNGSGNGSGQNGSGQNDSGTNSGTGSSGQGGSGQDGSGQGGGQNGNDQGSGGQNSSGSQGGAGGSQGSGGSQGGAAGASGSGSSAASAAAASGGSTNRDSGGGAGGHYEGDSFAQSKWSRIYAPKPIEHSGETVRPTGQVDQSAGDPVERAEFMAPSTSGESYVPYERAWQSAKQRSESDIGNQRIPARLRKLVRDYYDSQ